MTKTKKRQEFLAACMSFVHADFEQYVRTIAMEHTIANLGQELGELVAVGGLWCRPEDGVRQAYRQLIGDCESDEMAEGVEEEYRSWLKDARADAQRVRDAGLPLTLENARLAFERKGPFSHA